MALLKYFQKIEDSVSERTSKTKLRHDGNNQVKKRVKLLSAPQWNERKENYWQREKHQRAEIVK